MKIVNPTNELSPRRMRAVLQRAKRHGIFLARFSPDFYYRATFSRAFVAHVVDTEANQRKYDTVNRIKRREDSNVKLNAEIQRIGELHERGAR